MNYDFKALDDKEFEILCADLLGDALGVRIERFKRGRDSGVDGRYFEVGKREVVLQCKHRPESSITQLIRHLRVDELPKVTALAPARYLLALSHPLTRANKASIQRALAPYIQSPSDIYGKEDLGDLLIRARDVELRHHKLWMTSANVLSYLINKAVIDRGTFIVEEAVEMSRKYVKTAHHDRALAMLDELRVIILTGEPGIGKTTLAEQLCLQFAARGFTIVAISGEVRYGEEVFDADSKQLFYFDDFLGRNYLDALGGHEGNQIVQFIRRVRRNPNKRFILTSRSTILNQGKILIDTFSHHSLDKNELELRVSKLTRHDVARILYSHLWHSKLDRRYRDEIHAKRRYRHIIEHRNFNPRLISMITSVDRLALCPTEHYWSLICDTLRNPADVWQNAFEAQQDDYGRCLVLLVTLNRRPIPEHRLAASYARYLAFPENLGMDGRRDFMLNLKHLTGSLLSRHLQPGDNEEIATVDLFNPSIGDYVLRRYTKDVPSLRSAFLSLRTRASLQTLVSMHENKSLDEEGYVSILHSLLKQAEHEDFADLNGGYIAALILAMIKAKELSAGDRARVGKAVTCAIGRGFADVSGPSQLILWALRHAAIGRDDAARFILDIRVDRSTLTLFELSTLIDIRNDIGAMNARFAAVREVVKNQAIRTLRSCIDSEFHDADVFDDVPEGDEDAARENLQVLVEGWMDRLGVECSSDEIEDLAGDFDIEGREETYREEQNYTQAPRQPTRARPRVTEIDEIDDLFDRS
jgi:adenylate kinase family enzyme